MSKYRAERLLKGVLWLPALFLGCEPAGKLQDSADEVDACPVAAASPEALAWTLLPIGERAEASVVVENSCDGTRTLHVEAAIDNPIFSLVADRWDLAPGESATVTVFTRPVDYTLMSGNLTLTTDDPAHPTFVVPLSALADPDQDGDGYEYDVDCDEGARWIFPGAAETWYDGIDNDCAGDDDFDQDADGFAVDVDCDDTNADISPGAIEVCDGTTDENCDGEIDEAGASGEATWYQDGDADGFGDAEAVVLACELPLGASSIEGDCDDDEASIHPEAEEACNGADDDCDGEVDESGASGESTWYLDSERDGYGVESSTIQACDRPPGYADNADDCDDTTAAVNPSANETCDGIDEDCDSLIDEAGAVDAPTWYADADGDGYGDMVTTAQACDQPAGYTTSWDDCDDADAAISPSAEETCDNGIDEDCDGTDAECGPRGDVEAADASGYIYGESASDYVGYRVAAGGDVDGDGYGDIALGAEDHSATAYEQGVLWLMRGPATGDQPISAYTAEILGEGERDHLGCAVAFVGDVDGDGYDDIALGAWGDDDHSNGGAVFVLSGPVTGSAPITGLGVKLTGDLGYFVGKAVADAGDVNGDGFSDILIGSTAYQIDNSGAGAGATGGAYIVSGPLSGDRDLTDSDSLLIGDEVPEAAGTSVAGGGDGNGDGLDDVLIGAPQSDAGGTYSGIVYLVEGPSRSDPVQLADVGYSFVGEAASDRVGNTGTVAWVGDTDADGYDDVLVGATTEDSAASEAGAAYLLLGPVASSLTLSAADAKFTGTSRDYNAGAVTRVGDIDLDGFDDIYVGAAGATCAAGRTGAAFVYYGPPTTGTQSLSTADASLCGAASGDVFGTYGAGGDVDADGYADLIIGAYGVSDVAASAGAVYVYHAGEVF